MAESSPIPCPIWCDHSHETPVDPCVKDSPPIHTRSIRMTSGLDTNRPLEVRLIQEGPDLPVMLNINTVGEPYLSLHRAEQLVRAITELVVRACPSWCEVDHTDDLRGETPLADAEHKSRNFAPSGLLDEDGDQVIVRLRRFATSEPTLLAVGDAFYVAAKEAEQLTAAIIGASLAAGAR